ncbi:hypothetical protein AAG906_032843 [Vitis piasezkii]
MYPFTSLFLIVYCFHCSFSFTGAIRLIGGTSAHPAMMQGLLKVLRGGPCECGFKICRECYLDCVGSGGGHCPVAKNCTRNVLYAREVVTGSVTFNSPRGSRGLIQMIEHMNKSCPVVPSQLTSTSLGSSQFRKFLTPLIWLSTDIFCTRERDILINFFFEISRLQAQHVKSLRSMHVLIILEEDASFLRYGYLSPDNAVGIRKEVTILCELRPHALALRISFNWIDANSWSLVQPQQGPQFLSRFR